MVAEGETGVRDLILQGGANMLVMLKGSAGCYLPQLFNNPSVKH